MFYSDPVTNKNHEKECLQMKYASTELYEQNSVEKRKKKRKKERKKKKKKKERKKEKKKKTKTLRIPYKTPYLGLVGFGDVFFWYIMTIFCIQN